MGKNLLNAYTVTIGVTVFGTLLSVLISAAFAYVLTVREFNLRAQLNMFLYYPDDPFPQDFLPCTLMCTQILPSDKTRFLALVLPCCMNAFNVFLLRNFFKSIPEELAEAAKIDGANYLCIFRVIYFPLAKVGLVTVGLFYALSYWNDYYLSLMFINKQNMYPLQYYLYNMLSNVQFMANQANAPSDTTSIFRWRRPRWQQSV